MHHLKKRYIVAFLVIAITLAITMIPAIPYRVAISYPGFPYSQQGYQTCWNLYMKENGGNTSLPAFQQCISQFLIPPINVTGYGSLSYGLLGVGLQPFPNVLQVGENDFHAILFMSGAKVAAAEEVPENNVIYNPQGIVVSNASISRGFQGYTNVTVTVTNNSNQTLVNPLVFVSVPGTSGNYTDKNGITWIFTLVAPSSNLVGSPCSINGQPQNLSSGVSCTAILHPIISAAFGSSFRFSVQVLGHLGSRYSFIKQTFSYSISIQAVNQLWVAAFVGQVNAARNNSALVESPMLDKFASQRFKTAVTEPDISDYGLDADYASFFGSNSTSSVPVEILLFPNVVADDPSSYANFVRISAPGHWAALTNSHYSYFGYYVGTGPYEVVQQPCPISEIPRAGVNITQYFKNAGCSVSIQQSTWLVMILGG